MDELKFRKITLAVSIGMLVISLTQKCYCTSNHCSDSIAVFIFGGMGIFYGGAALCWLANPCLIFAWLFIKNNKLSLILSATSFLISLSFLMFSSIIDNEGGQYKNIISYAPGYWFWLLSTLSLFIGNIIIRTKYNSPSNQYV
ncbi:MAG: hypothetical protein WBP08_13530 [Saprospiraceae bacterium]